MFKKIPKTLYAIFGFMALGIFFNATTFDAEASTNFNTFATSGLTDYYSNVFSQNNITFWNPCEGGVKSNANSESCFKINGSTDAQSFWYAEGCINNGTCTAGIYASTAYTNGHNDFLLGDTKTDDDFGGMQYIYAENYDISYENWIAEFTPNGGSSTQKYYWVVLPSEAYSTGFGEKYVATFENLDEPVYFITYDTHACQHQGEDYCGKAKSDPDGVEIGGEFFGAFTKGGGNYTEVANIAGKLTSLCRIDGRGEITASQNESANKTTASNSGSSSSSSSSSSNSSSNSEVVWKDGWIESGLDGYVKEAAEGSGYALSEEGVGGGHTQDYATDGKPNKILLHSTEGGVGNGDSGLALYGSVDKGGVSGITPAHFTINLQDKKVFQHFSINKPSDAIIEDLDAGVQIEIIGFMNSGSSPALPDFSDEDWDYLAKLLIAISDETGIKLESSADWTHVNRYSAEEFRNYTGVLGHMHAPSDQNHSDPGDIWSKIEAAIERVKGSSGNICGGESTSTDGLAAAVMSFAWTMDELKSMGVSEWAGTMTPKDGYKEAVDRRKSEGKYVGGISSIADCGGFVSTLMNESGYEPRYNYNYEGTGSYTVRQEQWLTENWDLVTSNSGGFDTSQLKQGDVYINENHTYVFVGDIDGFGSNIASASLDSRMPQAGGNSASESGYRIYRKKGQ